MLEFEQAMLRERFQDLLASEHQAIKAYVELAARTTDPDILKKVEHLLRDKQRHVELTERLLEIVE